MRCIAYAHKPGFCHRYENFKDDFKRNHKYAADHPSPDRGQKINFHFVKMDYVNSIATLFKIIFIAE